MPNVFLLPADGMPPFGLGLLPAKGVLGRGRDRLLGALTVALWDRGLVRLNALRAERGLELLTHLWDQVTRAHRVLVLTSEAFDFPARLPANVRYVGAELCDPVWVEPWQAPPPAEQPFVLVALSSTFQDQQRCLQRIVEGLGALPARALVTTGPAIDPHQVAAPANVTVVRSAPHQAVLAHATCVVTHGGHGTVVKALAAGVPMVILHHGRDQADNMARVVARGAGISVKRSASPAKITAAVHAVLEDPSYRDAAARLGEIIRRDAAAGAVIDELEDLRGPGSATGRRRQGSTSAERLPGV